jgi:signal peptidase I
MNTWVANVTDELIDARLRAGDVVRFTITTASMRPMLAPGDQVSVRRARAAELRAGDIVIVKLNADAARLAHRLIARRVAEDGVRFVTKGDNCAAPDPLWTESQLCGIVTAVWRQDARAPTDLRSTRARWLGIFVAFVSRVQACAFALPLGELRRAALKASRILMRGSAWIARKMIG